MAESTNGKPIGAALVVGGGIAGVQAALDLADSGVKVYLVERDRPSAARWPSSTRPFRPTTAPCASCLPSWWKLAATEHRDPDQLRLAPPGGRGGPFLRPPSTADLATSTWKSAPPATTASRSAPSRSPTSSTRAWRRARRSTSPTPRPCPAPMSSPKRARAPAKHLPRRDQRPGLYRPHCRAALRGSTGSHQAIQPLPGHGGPRLPPSLRNRVQPGQAGQPGGHLRAQAFRGRHGL